MPAVNMLDAKTNLSRSVESLEQGSEREFIIARHGRPTARLVPLGNANPHHQRLGVAKGQLGLDQRCQPLVNHHQAQPGARWHAYRGRTDQSLVRSVGLSLA